MTKGLVKSLKKKQRLHEIFLKNRKPEKHFSNLLKRNQRNIINQILLTYTNIKKKSKKYYYSNPINFYKYNQGEK